MSQSVDRILAQAQEQLNQAYQSIGLDPESIDQDNPPAEPQQDGQVTPPAGATEPPQGQGQAQPPVTPPQDQGQAQPPANQGAGPAVPSSTPSNEDLLRQISELRNQVEQGNANYSNLRAFADRVAGENAKLKRGQAVSSLKPVSQDPAGASTATGTPQPPVPPGPSPVEAIEASIKKAEQVASDYPEIMEPVIEALRMQQQVIASLTGQVEPIRQVILQDEEEKQREEAENVKKRHFDTIRSAHKDYDAIVAHPDFPAWVQSLEGEDNADAVRICQQGSAYEVIGLLHRYKSARPQQQITPPPQDQQGQQRAAAAALDNEGRVLSTPPIQPSQLNVPSGVIAQSDIVKWSRRPELWAAHQKEIEYAQEHGLIDYTR